MMIPNMGAAHVSLELGTKGPLSATCTACAAGSDAIGYAARIIRQRRRRRRCSPAAARRPSARSAWPASPPPALSACATTTRHGASRPFDAGRDGFVIGEGAGCLVLEELEHAQARGARIYAELAGAGMSSDAFHMTLPDESGESQARAITMALKRGRSRARRRRLHQRPRHGHRRRRHRRDQRHQDGARRARLAACRSRPTSR